MWIKSIHCVRKRINYARNAPEYISIVLNMEINKNIVKISILLISFLLSNKYKYIGNRFKTYLNKLILDSDTHIFISRYIVEKAINYTIV